MIADYQVVLAERFPGVVVRDDLSVHPSEGRHVIDVFFVPDERGREFARFVRTEFAELLRARCLDPVIVVPHSAAATREYYPDVVACAGELASVSADRVFGEVLSTTILGRIFGAASSARLTRPQVVTLEPGRSIVGEGWTDPLWIHAEIGEIVFEGSAVRICNELVGGGNYRGTFKATRHAMGLQIDAPANRMTFATFDELEWPTGAPVRNCNANFDETVEIDVIQRTRAA